MKRPDEILYTDLLHEYSKALQGERGEGAIGKSYALAIDKAIELLRVHFPLCDEKLRIKPLGKEVEV